MPIRFTQSCPTCGRRVQIRASLVGYNVVCQHCSAEFVARGDGEPESATAIGLEYIGSEHTGTKQTGPDRLPSESVRDVDPALADPLMARVEAALKRAEDHSHSSVL